MQNKITRAIIQALRRIGYMNVHRNRVTAEARKERGRYQCAKCGQLFKRPEIHMDHVSPVIDPHEGFNGDWNGYIDRLFYGELQALCVPCHKAKTKEENVIRRQPKQEEDPHE